MLSTDVPSYLATDVKLVVSQVMMLSELCNNLCCHFVESFSHFNVIKKCMFHSCDEEFTSMMILFYVL